MDPTNIANQLPEMSETPKGFQIINSSDPDEIIWHSRGTKWFPPNHDEAMQAVEYYLRGGPIEIIIAPDGRAMFSRNPLSLGYPDWRDSHDRQVSNEMISRVFADKMRKEI
jgi:hypothetical protein